MGSFGTTASFYNIGEQLRALLRLKLNPRFVLTIRVVLDHQQYIDTRRLHELAPAINSVLHAFRETGYEVILEYHVFACYAINMHLNRRAWAWSQLIALSALRDFYLVQGTEAERMLNATCQTWALYLNQQDVLKESCIFS